MPVHDPSPWPAIRWGAVAIGAMAGLVVALLAFIFLGVTGLIAPGRGDIILLFIQFLSLVVAGYVGGRLSDAPEVHGGLAALLGALISGLISITNGGVAALVSSRSLSWPRCSAPPAASSPAGTSRASRPIANPVRSWNPYGISDMFPQERIR